MKVIWHYFFFPNASQDVVECVQGLRSSSLEDLSRKAINFRCFADVGLLNCFLDLIKSVRKIKVIHIYLLCTSVQSCRVNSRGFVKYVQEILPPLLYNPFFAFE